MIAESLNIPKTVVICILKDDLGKKKTYCRIKIPEHMHIYSVVLFIYQGLNFHIILLRQSL